MSSQDSFQKFMFPDLHIRGQWVRLESSFQEAMGTRSYPENIRRLLAETAAASVLLTGTLKFEGILSIHARGSGPVTLLMAECNDQREFRCLANMTDDQAVQEMQTMQALLGQAQLAITIDPKKGQRYQGIVPLERDTMATCLAQYFELSEQLDTYFEFYVTEAGVYALMLQKLPDYSRCEDQDAWDRLIQLALTLSGDEFSASSNDVLTTRLFHQEAINLYDEEPVAFKCSCSRERSLASLEALGLQDAMSILEESPVIEIDCQFCGAHYEFDRQAINALFNQGPAH